MAKILLIDDEESTRHTIREMLVRGNHEVVEASNGKEGLQVLQQQQFDAVVTDILMPEEDGLSFLRKMKKIAPEIPAVTVTASLGTPYLEAAKRLGSRENLYKPFTQVQLLDAVSDVLQEARAESSED